MLHDYLERYKVHQEQSTDREGQDVCVRTVAICLLFEAKGYFKGKKTKNETGP